MLNPFEQFKHDIADTLKQNLSEALTYHGFHHTLEVLANANEICTHEAVSAHEQRLLQTAVWLHDTGFMYGYAHHEERGCELARKLLPQYAYSEKEIELICGLIEATKIPQQPKTRLQNIIADADLMYLGTPQYAPIADTLWQELTHFTKLSSGAEWINIQIKFLEHHRYHTAYCQLKYEPVKQQNLMQLKEIQAQ
ncbi:MAG: HD domain-containing protein [Chitinophagaceae bacterium]|nr:HD domain-containing protein [Chitinophagaceae bacterium]